MCHWQWFLLIITISFVVSNGGERINRRRSIHIHPNSKKRRETSKPEELSTHVNFPLWVTIGGLESIGATTEYKKLNDKLYEFTLPFLVLVKESDVCTNRSATQDKNLAYPFWVRIMEIRGQYANQTIDGKVRLEFPFDLEVAMINLMDIAHRLEPVTREPITIISITVACVVAAIIIAHIIRSAFNTLWAAAVEIFRPHTHKYGQITRAKTIVGNVAGKVGGAIVSFVPGLGEVIQGGMVHIFQTFGDSLVMFVKELLTLHVLGDVMFGINIILNLFHCLPFIPWRKFPSKTPPPGVLGSPPQILVPHLPPPPRADINKLVVQIYYGQTTIPGFPEYLIVWPGKEEPPVTDLVIIRPIVPTLPNRPNIRLVWPLQSTNNVRPKIILIRPGQRFIPGYVNVYIAWPSEPFPPPFDQDLMIIRPYDRVIPNIIGIVLLWPGQVPNEGPYFINLLPGQRQSPDFPTIIFRYPGDPAPPNYPSITVAFPPQMDIPDFPGIKILWPPQFRPPSQVYPPFGPVRISPDDFQVPGFPNVLIQRPGLQQPRPMPGISYIQPGQPNIPGYPDARLQWTPQQQNMERFQDITVNIPPGFDFVPGFPDYPINRGGAPFSSDPRSISPGDKTLPDNPNVFLGWLDRPTDLVLETSPDIMQPNSLYGQPGESPFKRKRNVKRSLGETTAFLNEVETPEGEFMRRWKTDMTEMKYGGHNNTFDVEHFGVSIGGYGEVKFSHEKTPKQNPWNVNIKKSQLQKRFKQLFGLRGQG